MNILFEHDENSKVSKLELEEIQRRILESKNEIEKKFPLIKECLDKLEQDDEYFEINYPIFEYGITLTFSKLRKKFLVAVSDHVNRKVFGSLLLEGVPCMDMKELKKLRTWKSWDKNS